MSDTAPVRLVEEIETTDPSDLCGCGGSHVRGRACTLSKKRAVVEWLLELWERRPMLRLGQMLYTSHSRRGYKDAFFLEDSVLLRLVEDYTASIAKPSPEVCGDETLMKALDAELAELAELGPVRRYCPECDHECEHEHSDEERCPK